MAVRGDPLDDGPGSGRDPAQDDPHAGLDDAGLLEGDRDVLKELLTTSKSFVAHKSAAEQKKKRAEELAKLKRL